MAHTKAGGSTRQKGNRRGKHLGVKLYGGQKIVSGNIIVRQRGSSVHAGVGVRRGKDFTLYAIRDGIVAFIKKKDRQFVSVKSA
jgi:large subunit ribosomal protein L27